MTWMPLIRARDRERQHYWLHDRMLCAYDEFKLPDFNEVDSDRKKCEKCLRELSEENGELDSLVRFLWYGV